MSRYANKFSMDDVRLFWDGVAGEYARENEKVGWVHTQRFREALRRLDPGPGTRLLNIWSRTCGAVDYLRRRARGFVLVNAELSFELLRISRADRPGENLVHCTLHELPFCDRSFDSVLSLETLEHVPDPLLYLREVRRIMADGGKLVMSLPPATAEWTSVISDRLGLHHGEGPHRFLSTREVSSMLRETGFTLDDHTGTLFVPVNWPLCERIDRVLTRLFGRGPLAQLGLRQFYVCIASL